MFLVFLIFGIIGGLYFNKIILYAVIGIEIILICIFEIINMLESNTRSKCVFSIFTNDLSQKYEKIGLDEDEYEDEIKADFEKIILYDTAVETCNPLFHSNSAYIDNVEKFKINRRDAYALYHTLKLSSKEYAKNYFDIFIKTSINDRLQIRTATSKKLKNKTNFEDYFENLQEYTTPFDTKYFKDIKSDLSEEFYLSKFGENPKSKYLEIDALMKNKLIELRKKYLLDFEIVIKDNLIRIYVCADALVVKKKSNSIIPRVEGLDLIENLICDLLELLPNTERNYRNEEYMNQNEEYLKVKNIFFDLDNTLIFDEESDSEYYKDVLTNLGFDEENYYGIYRAIDEYDKSLTEENCFYNEQEMLDFINEVLNQNYPIELIEGLKKAMQENWIKRPLIREIVLENLSKKYNLYVYTNYFGESQAKRLENMGYIKYFKKVFGADKYGCKPYKKNFEKILNEIGAKPEECIMIGDTKKLDILAANNAGMKSILFDYNGKRDDKNIELKEYIVIKDMNDLGKILIG